MKKMMTLLSMIALAIVGTTMIGCSNKEYDIAKPEQPVDAENVITLTTTISLPDTDTKGLDIDYGNKKLSKTFKVGEQVALIYKKTNVTSDKVIYTLTEGDITNGGKTATLTFTVSEPDYMENLTYVYPAVITGGEYKASVDYTRLNTQDGTLASIASDLDLAMYTGPWAGENLPSANLTNELAIIAYTLKDEDGTNSLNNIITGITISDGTNTYVVNRDAAEGPIYVAIRPTSGAIINYTATDGTYYYTKSVTDKTYGAGQFYQLGLRMEQSSVVGHGLFFSTVGELVGSDGLAYPATAKNNLPVGVTAAGMVAYKDGKSGLVIALTDENRTMSRNEANGASGSAAHTPVVAGHAWKLPSMDDWTDIFNANGNTWTGLNTALESAGGTGVVGEDSKYWSSETLTHWPDTYYWYRTMNTDGTVSSGYTSTSGNSYYVRACFYFGYDPNAFSVSPTTQVTFAPGNLTRNGDTWQFLNNSWEYDGSGRGSQYFTWTEVFNDYNYSTVSSIKNEIATSLGSTSWRGLSTEEWRYLMGYDQNTNPKVQSSRRAVDWHRYAVVTNTNVGSGLYLLLFPDGFKESDWNTSTMGTKPTVFEHNGTQSISYTSDNFSAMQSAGIIILPPAGEWELGGYGWYQYKQGEIGLYWSSTCADETGAMSFQVWSAQVKMEWNRKSKFSLPVRLVKNK